MLSSMVRNLALGTAMACLTQSIVSPVWAETKEVRIASQYGFGFLPMMVMERRNLLEQEFEAAGVTTKVRWVRLGGGSAMNEAVLSGSLDVASSGVTPFITLWAKARGRTALRPSVP
jgi:NitT/TauT family transport system substrate-binding protein